VKIELRLRLRFNVKCLWHCYYCVANNDFSLEIKSIWRGMKWNRGQLTNKYQLKDQKLYNSESNVQFQLRFRMNKVIQCHVYIAGLENASSVSEWKHVHILAKRTDRSFIWWWIQSYGRFVEWNVWMRLYIVQQNRNDIQNLTMSERNMNCRTPGRISSFSFETLCSDHFHWYYCLIH
jgi:hypothetical protein